MNSPRVGKGHRASRLYRSGSQGEGIGGDCWRTAGDLGFELDAFFDVAAKNAEHRAWSRPGAWNDPDYIQIGYVGTARGNGLPELCSLTPNEQYSFMSLWCLMAAPLFYSGDMSRLDDFTLNVLGNPEVIEVDQDPLGQSAAVATITDETFLLIKDLHDGSRAVGLFNRGELPAKSSRPGRCWDCMVSNSRAISGGKRNSDLSAANSKPPYRDMELCWCALPPPTTDSETELIKTGLA